MPVLILTTRGLCLRLLGTNPASIKLPPLQPQLKRTQILFPRSQDQEDDEGLFIPSFLEEALGGDGNLQIKMACTMQAQEKQKRRFFICQSTDHLMRDHYQGKNGKGPLQLKGPPQNKSAREMAKTSLPS